MSAMQEDASTIVQRLILESLRRGKRSDVTNVVDFFLSEQSGIVTGQAIYLGGANA